MTTIYDRALDRNDANYAALSPVDFLRRSAAVHPDKVAIVHGAERTTYARFLERARRLASALAARGVQPGDTVAVVAPNTPAMLEAHFGVPMAGAVLNSLNIRLDGRAIGFILDHGRAKVLLSDRAFSGVVEEALAAMEGPRPLVVDIDDALAEGGALIGDMDYEALLAEGDPAYPGVPVEDEWQAIGLNYTSGTTGNPKGVVIHHRGAYLNALGNVLAFGLGPASVYLWTLPMFHCNGWTYTWAVTAVAGTHVCLRAVEPAEIFPAIAEHGVTHMCGAPIVLNMLVHAPDEAKVAFGQTVEVATGGAAPPSAVISAMERMGFRVTHLYGLTETYGPATYCASQRHWEDLDLDDRAREMSRQGVAYATLEAVDVIDPATLAPVPRDGQTIGEVMVRGNTVMKGYLKNPDATADAFAGGWYHTGDLGVMHPTGYIEIKDRSKDIIISGGENISSLEIEEVLYRHPDVVEAAVVAKPDEKWGETPCAFVLARDGANLDAEGVVGWCRDNMAHFKCPRHVVFGPLPKTSTGKIQKYVLRERAREA
jgi:fatty-acyl-CoA synthase